MNPLASYDPRGSKPLRFLDSVHDFYRGSDSPRDYLERCIARIQQAEPNVQAFVHLADLEDACRQADLSSERYRARKPLSPIDGMPLGIKDLYSTVDMPTQMGSPIYKNHRSLIDCAAVHGLRAAGAIIVGKTVTTEFGFFNPGPTRNPFDLERTPGGSSSGSAACVAAKMVPAAIGGQVMGSLLRPASFCGTVGFKPGLGIVNRDGNIGAALSHGVIGVLAGSVEDAWAITYQISSRAGGDAGHRGLLGAEILAGALQPTRIGMVATADWAFASEAARCALNECAVRLRGAGVEIVDSSDDDRIRDFEASIADAKAIGDTICGYELRWKLNEYEIRYPGMLSPDIRARLQEWNNITAQHYWEAVTRRAEARKYLAALQGRADALMSLSATGAAPKGLTSTGDPIFAVASSILGAPAFSLPIMMQESMPLGLQLIGLPGHEEELARHSVWIMERALQW